MLLTIIAIVAALAALAALVALIVTIYTFRSLRQTIKQLQIELESARDNDLAMLKAWFHDARVEDQKDIMRWVRAAVKDPSTLGQYDIDGIVPDESILGK